MCHKYTIAFKLLLKEPWVKYRKDHQMLVV